MRDDVIKIVNDTPVIIDIEEEYSAGQENPKNRNENYSAMIIYGLLSYYDGELRIPNKELMSEFQKALRNDKFGYIAELARNSDEVLYAAAIAQIREKGYSEKLKKEKVPAILLVGISYDSSKKEHQCIIEELI